MPCSATLTLLVLDGPLPDRRTIARCAEIVVEENITYGKAGDTELKLDLARPQGDGPFPAIVFIHGGGWYQGNRQGYRGQIQEAAKRGYVAATISYRLMQFDESKKETTTATPIFPAQIHDAKAAIRWLRANAKKYHVDPDRIGVTGGSAGGHLSLLGGLTDPCVELGGRQRESRAIQPGAGGRQRLWPNGHGILL